MSRIDGVPLLRAKWCLRVTIRADRRTLLPLLSLLPFAACGGVADSSRAAATTVDSAGVQIVTSTDPAWPDGGGWQISAAPALEIGMAEGPNEYLLSRVRDARRRSDGSILIANAQTAEIRVFDAEGGHVQTIGRRGQGPGEFSDLARLKLGSGDSILAYDYIGRRLSLFTPEGEFVRSATLQAPESGSFPHLLGLFGDGSMVAVATDFRGFNAREGEVSRMLELYVRYGPTGELVDTLSLQPGSDTYMETSTMSDGMRVVSMTIPLFGRSSVSGMLGDRAVLGSNDSYELQVLTPDGDIERLIRRSVEVRPVTEEMVAAARRERAAEARDEEARQHQEEALRGAPHGATVPFYEEVMGDDDGNLWVQEFTVPGEAAAGWAVFDPEGRLLGSVQMPERFRPTHIGADFVLGVARDEMDVERVRLYTLEKGEGL